MDESDLQLVQSHRGAFKLLDHIRWSVGEDVSLAKCVSLVKCVSLLRCDTQQLLKAFGIAERFKCSNQQDEVVKMFCSKCSKPRLTEDLAQSMYLSVADVGATKQLSAVIKYVNT